MKRLLLPILALVCCTSGALAQQTSTEKKTAAMESAKNSAIKSANEQYQATAAGINKSSMGSITRAKEEIENVKSQSAISTQSGNSGPNSPSNKKIKELEKRIKLLQERQDKLLKEAYEQYLKKFNQYKRNHYVGLKPISPEKAEAFMKECTPLDPITAADAEQKK